MDNNGPRMQHFMSSFRQQEGQLSQTDRASAGAVNFQSQAVVNKVVQSHLVMTITAIIIDRPHTISYISCHCDCIAISHQFRVAATFWPKMALFLLFLYLSPACYG